MEKRVIGEIDTANHMARLEANLLGLSEIVGGVTVELHLSKPGNRNILYRQELGWVQHIKAIGQDVGLIHNLNTVLPLREIPSLNSIVKVLAMEIEILPGNSLGLFPDHTSDTLQTSPLDLNKLGGAVVGHESVSVNTISVDVAEGTGYTVAGHEPEHTVEGGRLGGEEVIGGIVGSGSLRNLVLGLGLDGVNQVGELTGILDEEHRDIDSDNVCSSY